MLRLYKESVCFRFFSPKSLTDKFRSGKSYWSNCWERREDEIRNRERIKDSHSFGRFEDPHPGRFQKHPYRTGSGCQSDFGKPAWEGVWESEDGGFEDERKVLIHFKGKIACDGVCGV